MQSEKGELSEKNIKDDKICNIFLKIPAKNHHDVTVEEHEKITLLKQKKQWNFDGVFWDHETAFETPFIRNILQKNLCKVLEGFDCLYLIGETSSKYTKFIEFRSVLIANLELLRKIFKDLQDDHITYLIKSSFFISQENIFVKDFFEDMEEMKGCVGQAIQAPNNKYFIDCNELINLVKYKLENVDLGEIFTSSFQICFKLELFLYNNQEKICWKGKWLLIDHCTKSFSFDTILGCLNGNFSECQIPDLLLQEMKNSYINIYLKYNEVTSDVLEKDCEKLDQIQNKAIKMPIQNSCNNINDYISMILDLQKRACVKDYELYNKNMNLFLKEKELDECKLKIAQLESSLHYQEEKLQNVSIVEPNFDEEENPVEDLEHFTGPERTQTILDEENFPKIFRSISYVVGHSLNQTLRNKTFSSVNLIPDTTKYNRHNDEILFEVKENDGAYEQLLEINYYEELTMLRTKFQKVNKELVKKSCENEKMAKLIEKLKEQHIVFNNLNANGEEKKIDDPQADLVLQTINKQEGEIKVLKKLLWEKGKIIVLCWRCRKNKRWDLGKNTRNSGGKGTGKKGNDFFGITKAY